MVIILSLVTWLWTGAIAKTIYEPYNSEDGPLNLTPLIDKGEFEKARNLSAVEPTLFAGVASHAAYITINKTNKWNQFFWFFPAEGKPLEITPWLIWLQGGPGGSSLYGLFCEIGPLKIVNKKAERMPVTWGSEYSLLFIDNPIGVGFSYSESDAFMSNEDDVGAGLLNFIQQFLQVFSELRKAPLFITGESYAGKYIPAFGHYIHQNKNDSLPINLKGLAIGDGWTDPPTLMHYSELALQIGLLDPGEAEKLRSLEDSARKSWKEGNIEEYKKYAYKIATTADSLSPNPYNFLNDLEIDATQYVNFLNQKEVQKNLHVQEMTYAEMNNKTYDNFFHELFLSAKPWLEELLEHYGVLCYNGQLDILVGYALSVNTYHSLNWTGSNAYIEARRHPIDITNGDQSTSLIGFVKASGNFMDVMIRGAGHMVPADQPVAAKHVIKMFVDKFK